MGLSEVLARNLKALRGGLTQRELADAAGVHVEVIRGIEQGRTWPERENLERLARALHIQAADFFTTGARAHSIEDCIDTVARISRKDDAALKRVLIKVYGPKLE
jgi:transcriptional regulator with XRE-family HTH domain